MISIKIDVMKIDKSRLFKGKEGAMYLDIILIDKQAYGNDYMAVQQIPKEERDAGKRGNILGNGKIIGAARPNSGDTYASDSSSSESGPSADDLPF